MQTGKQGLQRLILGLGLGLGVPVGVGTARAELPPSGLEQMKTAKQIKANLQADPTLTNNRIDVRVSGDVATLTGTVDSDAEKMRAARLANVRGIEIVDNQLKVESSGAAAGAAATAAAAGAGVATAGTEARNAITDSGITASLKTQFLANENLRHEDIRVDTDNGVVMLKGHVSTVSQHDLAVDMARHTAGVARVEDDLIVVPR
jgi:hyperosmotically inducible protein